MTEPLLWRYPPGMIRFWNPDDPNRGCYTCGRDPDGRFPDGSPSYKCSHPAAEELPGVTVVTFRWTATGDAVADAFAVAREWERLDVGLQGKEFPPRPPWTQFTTDWRSILAEDAAAHITGLPRVDKLMRRGDKRRGKLKRHDIGRRTEVRCPQRRGGGLRVTTKDLQPGRLGMLVYDDLFRPYTLDDRPTFVAVGWKDVNDVARDEERYETRYSKPPDHRVWSVPGHDLEPMQTLPGDA